MLAKNVMSVRCGPFSTSAASYLPFFFSFSSLAGSVVAVSGASALSSVVDAEGEGGGCFSGSVVLIVVQHREEEAPKQSKRRGVIGKRNSLTGLTTTQSLFIRFQTVLYLATSGPT